jgi:uroporphyrinogen-III synthase
MLLVTRPREQAQDWVAGLQAAGVAASTVPLLGIEAVSAEPQLAALSQAWGQLASFRAVMFVSPNAVSGFFASARAPWPAHTWAVAPGPGTAAALQAQGIAPAQIMQPPQHAKQFDSESLWPELACEDWADQSVLVVSGEGGRDWLIQRWQEAGAQVHTVVAYRRAAPVLLEAEAQRLRWAVAQPQQAWWLWSSSEALAHLPPLVRAQVPRINWSAWVLQAQGLATHPRILEQAHRLGFAKVQACRADLASVVAAYNRQHRVA